MSEGVFTVIFIIASLGGVFLSLYLGAKGIDPEQIGRKASNFEWHSQHAAASQGRLYKQPHLIHRNTTDPL